MMMSMIATSYVIDAARADDTTVRGARLLRHYKEVPFHLMRVLIGD